jgi:hypothetical protein
MPSLLTLLTVLSALAIAGCARSPRWVEPQSRAGYVGPIEVKQLAHLLVGNSTPSYGSLPVRDPPFLIAVSPVVKPKKPHRLVCKWKSGRLKSFTYVPGAPRNPDGTPDPDVDWVDPVTDFGRVEQIFRFSEGLVASPGLVEDIEPRHHQATYHVAYLCSEGARVALMVGYVHSLLAGWGSVLILERAGQTWRFVEATHLWEA